MTAIGVVMGVYNGGATLAATLDSILAQTERDFELIVVDDGSTDATPRILAEYAARDPRVRVLTQPNQGLTRALIAGCAAARGAYIARHDAGDLSHPRRFELQKAALDGDPGAVFVGCATQYVGPELEPLYVNRSSGAALERAIDILDLDDPRILRDGPTHHGSVMFRRDAYERAGGYRAAFYYGQDFDLWYRLAETGTYRALDDVLYTARLTPDSISAGARERQDAIGRLSREALRARKSGRSDEEIVKQAAAIRPVKGNAKRSRAEGSYFIGETLRRNGDGRALRYLRSAVAARPIAPRAWLRLAEAGAVALHRKLGLKYRADRFLRYARRFGVARAVATRRRIWAPGGATIEVAVPRIAHPVALRTGTADASTFEKMFVWSDYEELEYPADVRAILDAGANIGLSAVMFANRFPGARIIAVEPEASNFALLERNVAPYPNVVPLRAALWSAETQIGLSNPNDHVDSFRFHAGGGEQLVDAFTVDALLDRFGIAVADVLKVDIEGAEAEVFAASDAWIGRVRMFVVELHGAAAQASFTNATARLDARRYRHGENDVVVLYDRAR